MPPKKKGNEPSNKTVMKQKEKLVEDKTFGLKNKNKSKQVQKYIKGVQQQVLKSDQRGGADAQLQREYAAKQEKEKAKEQKALFASLFKSVSAISQTKLAEGEDPKSVLCAYFKQGVCEKGKKCKFSHNLELDGKSAKIDLYTDPRDKKGVGTNPGEKTDITCKHFLEAVEKELYGWNWECPNKGKECQYRHCLPLGYVLEKDKPKEEEEVDPYDELTLEEKIENERQELKSDGLTPVTFESFMEWKKKRQERREAEIEEKRKAEAAKTGGKGSSILSGKALFKFDPTLFQDQEDAIEEAEFEEEKEQTQRKDSEEIEDAEVVGQYEEGKEPEEPVAQKEEVKVDESLFSQEQVEEEPQFD